MESNGLPLEDISVLDLTRARAGPTAVRQLADWGADVIQIEMPPADGGNEGMTGARHGPDFQNLHRNKRSMTLNLKKPEGRDIFLKMAAKVDVIVENYRPRVKHRLRIDYDTIRAFNARIIYGSISGFGQTGPYADRPGVDQIAQGMGGLMSITGLPGQGPVRVGIPIADLTAGMSLAQGILVALYERHTSGEGQWVHTSLLEAQIAMLDFQAARWLIAKDVAPQAGNDHPTGIPTGVFETSDGHINIAAAGFDLYARMCKALGRDELVTHDDYNTHGLRSKNRVALNAEIASVTKHKTSAEWIEIMNEAGVPCGPINTIDQTFADPQVQELGITPLVDHPKLGEIRVVGQAVNLTRTPQPAKLRRPTAELSEHTEEILTELGLSADEVAALHERKVI